MSSFSTCKVCHQHFSLKGPAPFLLPCLHSVCETCVTSAAGGVISCSTCQSNVNLTETRLQKDVITEKETLHLTAQHCPELILCTYDEDGNKAVCWCKDCEEFLCNHCQITHGRFKITRHHVVEDIGDIQPRSFDVDEYCTIHPKYLLDTWDEQCCILICKICQEGEHAEHKTIVFDKAVESTRREVDGFEKKIKSSVTQLQTHSATIDSDLTASIETFGNLTENISNTFNSLKIQIDQRENELQIELQQHQEMVIRELNEKKNTSDTCQKKCQTTSDYISKALQYSSRHDIMSLKHILQSKTRECISSVPTNVHKSPPLPWFKTNGLEKCRSFLDGFGRLAWTEDSTEENSTNDFETQTENSESTEWEEFKKKLLQLKTSYENEIHSLRETLTKVKEEEKKGIYRLTREGSDDACLLNCIQVKFSSAKYNAKYVHINTEGELINREQTNPPKSQTRLKKYIGTSSDIPLPICDSPLYFEIKPRLSTEHVLTGNRLLLEIGLAKQGVSDQHHSMNGRPCSYSLTVAHCPIHNSICGRVWRQAQPFPCLPDTLQNTPGTSATLHYGVVYDSVRGRIAFLDVKDEKIIGKIDNVDSSSALWPMFGVYNPSIATVSMSLVVDRYIDMTESKKALLLQSLS